MNQVSRARLRRKARAGAYQDGIFEDERMLRGNRAWIPAGVYPPWADGNDKEWLIPAFLIGVHFLTLVIFHA